MIRKDYVRMDYKLEFIAKGIKTGEYGGRLLHTLMTHLVAGRISYMEIQSWGDGDGAQIEMRINAEHFKEVAETIALYQADVVKPERTANF